MTFRLVLRSIGRVLWFAIAGAICMALIGVVAGGVSGGLITFGSSVGALAGTAYAVVIGFCSGAIAFGSAGTMACFSNLPKQVFGAAWRLAWRTTLLGTAIGGVLCPINMLLFGRFFGGRDAGSDGYVIGVIAGFTIGTFYGALVGAKREIARQKLESSQQQNAALS